MKLRDVHVFVTLNLNFLLYSCTFTVIRMVLYRRPSFVFWTGKAMNLNIPAIRILFAPSCNGVTDGLDLFPANDVTVGRLLCTDWMEK